MPKVTIVRPDSTLDQDKNTLKNIADVMEKIIRTEFGTKVKVELFHKKSKEAI